MTPSLFRLAAPATLICGFVASEGSAQQQARPAQPLDPITTILEAFRSHEVVALGEGAHGNEQGHAFRLALIRDPRFSAAVTDIVVEFGNARYQDVMDRFVRGENVSYAALRDVWQNTTQVTPVWDKPIYEEFFRAVRAVNSKLAAERKLRVLLGDPPIDWENTQTFTEANKWMADRTRHPADVIRQEVLAKRRRALVIYGEGHLVRQGRSIVQLLESSAGIKIFTIAVPISMPTATPLTSLQADAISWSVPSIAMLPGTVLGAANVTAYFAPVTMAREGKPASPGPAVRQQPLPSMQDQFDAILYIGDPSTITMSRLSPERCADMAYMEMRRRRIALMPPQMSAGLEERLKHECSVK
jgi:hypothetical protein